MFLQWWGAVLYWSLDRGNDAAVCVEKSMFLQASRLDSVLAWMNRWMSEAKKEKIHTHTHTHTIQLLSERAESQPKRMKERAKRKKDFFCMPVTSPWRKKGRFVWLRRYFRLLRVAIPARYVFVCGVLFKSKKKELENVHQAWFLRWCLPSSLFKHQESLTTRKQNKKRKIVIPVCGVVCREQNIFFFALSIRSWQRVNHSCPKSGISV